MRPFSPAAALACLLLSLPAAVTAQDLDLEGTWYVLIHYKDDHAGNPEQERWDDRVWVFERNGRRLKWTEYPIVVFEDEAGRFERRATGQYARILHSWEPDAGQRADIRDGLQVNSRGSKTKTLRGNDADGWSSSRSRGAASASVVTYEEVWSIEGLPVRPVFRRADMLGGGRTDSMEGLTEYATTEVEGETLRGSFERDGSRHGTFTMMRSGEVGAVEGAKDQKELQQKVFRREMERALERDVDDGAKARGAEHDDSVRYLLPFESETPRQLLQGVQRESGGQAMQGKLFRGFRRPDSMKYAFEFKLPVGTPVVAARAGEVIRVVDGFSDGGPQPGNARLTNLVVVAHEDGSFATYTHLEKDIPVEKGQQVERGEVIAKSGDTGQLYEPELLFMVQRLDEEGRTRSVDIRFDDGSAEGFVPTIGAYYGGKGSASDARGE